MEIYLIYGQQIACQKNTVVGTGYCSLHRLILEVNIPVACKAYPKPGINQTPQVVSKPKPLCLTLTMVGLGVS